MRVFLFVLGGLMMIAGATSIGLGIDVIQIERGWTQVIAGAIVFAGGAVVLGLAAVVARLEHLKLALAKSNDDALALAPRPQPADAADATLVMASDPPTQPAVKPRRAPDAAPTPTPDAAAAAALLAARGGDTQAPLATDIDRQLPVGEEPARQEAAGETPVHAETAASTARFTPAPSFVAPDAPATSFLPAGEASHAPGEPAAPRVSPALPLVMGRYEAKDASYVMFSDGSIEANTKSGVFRFGSMSELKAFIESQV